MSSQRAITLIVIHCSATPSGKTLRNAVENSAQVMDRWHKVRGFARSPAAVRGFSSDLPHLGYHYVIETDGRVLNGRSLSEAGAHAKDYNAHSIGICLVGGVEKTGRYTPKQWVALQELVDSLCAEQSVPLRFASAHKRSGVCGHRDLSADLNQDGAITEGEWVKTCPGFSVQSWLANGCVPADQHVYTGAA